MNLDNIKSLVTSKSARALLQTRKHSPRILFVGGVIGVVGATVLACRATLKVSDVLDEHEKEAANVNHRVGLESLGGQAKYHTETDSISSEDAEKELNKLKIKTAIKIVKGYIPAAVIMAGSVAALTGSHVILTRREGAVSAALIGLDKAYKQYRKNVVAEYGPEMDYKLANSAEEITVVEKTADGKDKVTSETVIKDRDKLAAYSVVFDEFSGKFTKEPGMNSQIIMMSQNYANDKLKAKGHLFLNEVLDMLELPRRPEGQVVGWIYKPDDAHHVGDNYVSFGVFEGDVEHVEAFLNGKEKRVVLNFNVDGPIWKLI